MPFCHPAFAPDDEDGGSGGFFKISCLASLRKGDKDTAIKMGSDLDMANHNDKF